jgi:hypothetical protein
MLCFALAFAVVQRAGQLALCTGFEQREQSRRGAQSLTHGVDENGGPAPHALMRLMGRFASKGVL